MKTSPEVQQTIPTPYWKLIGPPPGFYPAIPNWSPFVKFRPHRVQIMYYHSRTRFTIATAGRRGGKSEIALRRCILRMIYLPVNANVRNFFIAAPTRDQVKRIYWEKLKRLMAFLPIKGAPNESELTITLAGNGAKVFLLGLDKPQRMEGTSFVGGLIDEFGNIKPDAWKANIRPALEDTRGYADILGVPEAGGIHYQELYERAISDTTGEWSAFTWTSASVLDADIIASAKRDLDEETFEREYGGKFIVAGNIAYYAFSKENILNNEVAFRPELPLDISFDFNVAPMTSIIAQTYPDGTTIIIDEAVVPLNGNTQRVVSMIINKYQRLMPKTIRVYGDMTGLNRHTSQINGNDFDIIETMLRGAFTQSNILMPRERINPLERSRVMTVNARLRNYKGVIRCYVNARCKYLIRDFMNVQRKPNGELDKKYSEELTHISDAAGYYLHSMFGGEVNEAKSGYTKTLSVFM